MIRFLLNAAISVVSAAVALVVATLLIDGMELRVSGFFIAVAIFVVAQVILDPLVTKLAHKYAPAVIGGVGIISTLLSLWITSLIGSSLSITGFTSWLGAALTVWIITALITWLLGYLVIKRWWMERVRDRDAAKRKGRAAHGSDRPETPQAATDGPVVGRHSAPES